MRRNSRNIRLAKHAALVLWTASTALMVLSTVNPGSVTVRIWALWTQGCAWGFTAWWLMENLSRRDRLRVAELAEIMARVAAEGREEQRPKHAKQVKPKLTRVH